MEICDDNFYFYEDDRINCVNIEFYKYNYCVY